MADPNFRGGASAMLTVHARDRHAFSFVTERGRRPGASYSVSF